jgi:hypothetical protein
MRACSKCGIEHPVSFFNKDRSKPDGLYPSCKDCSRKTARVSYRAYETAHRAMKQRWKAANRERSRAINTAWAKANPDKTRKRSADYRARLIRATPPWADLELIKFVRSECPKGWHVDHIYALDGETSCGLNVVENLQYLPAAAHFKKGRKPPVDAGGYSDL